MKIEKNSLNFSEAKTLTFVYELIKAVKKPKRKDVIRYDNCTLKNFLRRR